MLYKYRYESSILCEQVLVNKFSFATPVSMARDPEGACTK